MLSVSATVNLPLRVHTPNKKKRLIGSLSNAIYFMRSVGKMFTKESAKLSTPSKSIPNKTNNKYYYCQAMLFCFFFFFFRFFFRVVFFYAKVNMKKANAPNNFVLFLYGLRFFFLLSIWPNVTWVLTINKYKEKKHRTQFLLLFFTFCSAFLFHFTLFFFRFVWFATKQSRDDERE